MASVRTFIVFSLVSILPACAGASAGGTGDSLELPDRFVTYFRGDLAPHRTVIATPVDRLTAVMPEAYSLVGLPVARTTEGDELMFITPALEVRGRLYEGERNSTYIDCGTGATGARSDQYELRLALYTRLTPTSGDSTVVETLLSGFAHHDAIRGGEMPCRGTGKLEQQIANILVYLTRGR